MFLKNTFLNKKCKFAGDLKPFAMSGSSQKVNIHPNYSAVAAKEKVKRKHD